MTKKNNTIKENVGVDQQNVPVTLYNKLQDQFKELQSELETYKQRSPIVGVRWFGGGGFGIGLTHPVNGINKIALDGYGDKAVIDYATWLRICNTEHARFGLLVRDDTVIDELKIIGVPAKKDNSTNTNSFTNAEVTTLLKGSTVKLVKVLDEMTSHWAPIRFLKEYEILNLDDDTKRLKLEDRRNYLLCRFRWSLLHPHDLRQSCEQYKIPNWQDLDKEEILDILTKRDLAITKDFM